LFFKLLLPLAYRDLRVPQRFWRCAADMVARWKAGSPCGRSGKIGIGNWEDLEEVILVLEKLGGSHRSCGGCSRIGKIDVVLSLPSIPAALIVP
jgi:hypothetical protein